MEKRCTGPCGQVKPLKAFSKRTKSKDGLQFWCKQCIKERKQKLPNHKQQRAHKLKHLYGLTVEQWDAMIIAQAGLCNLCDEPMKNPHVDHSHITGEVRSLLCLRCNTILGHVELLGLAHIEAYLGGVSLLQTLDGIPARWESFYRDFLSSSYN
jgi:Recombination endonuclease VII